MKNISNKTIAFVALSLVSLFADMTYEGARSVLGPYTRILGGSALVAGGLAIGDLIGYLTRAATGGFLHRIRRSSVYWILVFSGYIINLGVVPLLAFAGSWQIAFMLVILERAGKGIRAPARDVVLSEVVSGIGTGRGFAIHEFLDQVGAVLGPLIVAYTIINRSLHWAFLILAIPATIAIALLVIAFTSYPRLEETMVPREKSRLESMDHIIVAGLGLSIAALPLWPVLTYGWNSELAAGYYAIAMIVDAFAALIAGEFFQRIGIRTLFALPIAAMLAGLLLYPALTYMGSWLIIAAIIWGLFMGIFEVYSRAGVAEIVPKGSRSIAYGLLGFYTAIGLILSGIVYGAFLQNTVVLRFIPFLLAIPSLTILIYGIRNIERRD